MAYDESLAARVRSVLDGRTGVERKMFGGLAFLLDGRMFCGIVKGELMVRVGPEDTRRRWPSRTPGRWTSPDVP